MTNVEIQPIRTFTEIEFTNKIHTINDNLKAGKMWMNENCETQNKNHVIVRWIKCIISIILPIDLFSSIRINHVALNYFKLVEKNKEHLKNQTILDQVKNVLVQLNEKSREKYEQEIRVHLAALDGLFYTKDKK